MISSWLHLTSLVLYLGAVIGLWLVLLPALAGIDPHEKRVEFLVRGLKLYNPLQIGVLGVLVITGAFQITDLKSAYREMFLHELGMTLGWKLLAAFFLILVSTYQSMGVAHHFVRRHEGGESSSAPQLDSLCRRLRFSSLLLALLTLVTSWLGMRLRG